MNILDSSAAPGNLDNHHQPGVVLTFDDGYLNTIAVAKPILDERNLHALLAVSGGYLDPASPPLNNPHISKEFATGADLREWVKAGHDLAGHSLTHPNLTLLTIDELHTEISADLRAIECATGQRPATFCYPFGKANPTVREAISSAYQAAFVTDGGHWAHPTHRFQIRRLEIRPAWDLEQFIAHVFAALEACTSHSPSKESQ